MFLRFAAEVLRRAHVDEPRAGLDEFESIRTLDVTAAHEEHVRGNEHHENGEDHFERHGPDSTVVRVRVWPDRFDSSPFLPRLDYEAGPMSTAVADVAEKTVSFEGQTYNIQELGDDTFTVLVKGVPVGRIVLSFGAPNGVPEGDAASEDTLYAIAEAWFAAIG